ncbi:MAG: cytochrome c3 family protein [Nitrospirae bacterium]|nr:cytochrome c3 family protein [Nitrospirota bacterium]
MKKMFVCCLALLFASTVTAAEKNLVELHKNAGKMSNKECLACHGKIIKDVTLNKKFKTYHRVHLESKLDTPKNCADCHQSIDVRNGSAAALRKQVDPQICAGCHSGGMKGAKVLYAQ